MTTGTAPTPAGALLAGTTRVPLRPRYEGANICTWIGFKHVNYLVEEAVLAHFRAAGAPAGALYEDFGLGLDLVELDTRVLHALHVDDEVTAVVVPATAAADRAVRLRVTLTVDRGGRPRKAATARVAVVLRAGDPRSSGVDAPAGLARFVVPVLGAHRPAEPSSPPGRTGRPGRGAGRRAAPTRCSTGSPPAATPTAGGRRSATRYCHFTEWLQLSGYLRLLEEAVDRFLADRGISIATLLADRRWIPVVPRSRVEILAEARMEEDLYTVYTVEDVFKDATYTSRLDCYVRRDGALRPTATGSITHGYAVIESRRDWRLVPFDDRVLRALAGPVPAGAGGGSP